MTDQTTPLAGLVGPHRESHEPRLDAMLHLAEGVTPVAGFLKWNGAEGIGERWGMADNGQWGCCGFSAWQHANMAKGHSPADGPLTTWLPAYPSLLPAYWAYGLAMGEVGQPPRSPDQPDFGVSNASMLAWALKLGLIYGYGEVTDEYHDWFAQTFDGVLVGQVLDGNVASRDFEHTPRIPWDTMATPDGHDTLTIITHPDGSGATVTWGAVQPYTAAYRQTNWTDRWVIFDKDDDKVNWTALEAALADVHGVDVMTTARANYELLHP